MVVSKTIPKYKLYPFSDQKGPKTIRFGAANICLTRTWLSRFKVLFGSQYRARSPLSEVSDKLECNPNANYWMIPLVAIKYEEISTSPKCTVVLAFSVMDGRMQKSDFNCAAPVSPGREITVPCFLSARPSPVSDVFVRSEIWRFLWSGGSSQSLDGQLPTTDPDTDP